MLDKRQLVVFGVLSSFLVAFVAGYLFFQKNKISNLKDESNRSDSISNRLIGNNKSPANIKNKTQRIPADSGKSISVVISNGKSLKEIEKITHIPALNASEIKIDASSFLQLSRQKEPFQLQLFSDKTVTIYPDEQFFENAFEHTKGRLNDNSLGEAILTTDGKSVVVGTIQDHPRIYQLVHAANNNTYVIEVDKEKIATMNDKPRPSESDQFRKEFPKKPNQKKQTSKEYGFLPPYVSHFLPQAQAAAIGNPNAPNKKVVRLIAYYTPEFQEACGGVAGAEGTIANQAAVFNNAMAFAGSELRLEMFYEMRSGMVWDHPAATSAQMWQIMGSVNRNDSGYAAAKIAYNLDGFAIVRASALEQPVAGGIRRTGGETAMLTLRENGYAMLWVSLTFFPTFALTHELGHTLGADHDWDNTGAKNPANINFGYVTPQYRTVMSSGPVGMFPVFSDFLRDYGGNPLGNSTLHQNGKVVLDSSKDFISSRIPRVKTGFDQPPGLQAAFDADPNTETIFYVLDENQAYSKLLSNAAFGNVLDIFKYSTPSNELHFYRNGNSAGDFNNDYNPNSYLYLGYYWTQDMLANLARLKKDDLWVVQMKNIYGTSTAKFRIKLLERVGNSTKLIFTPNRESNGAQNFLPGESFNVAISTRALFPPSCTWTWNNSPLPNGNSQSIAIDTCPFESCYVNVRCVSPIDPFDVGIVNQWVVKGTPVSIISDLKDVTLKDTCFTSVSVTASGTAVGGNGLQYKWYKNNKLIELNNVYKLPIPSMLQMQAGSGSPECDFNGRYKVEVIGINSVFSREAIVTHTHYPILRGTITGAGDILKGSTTTLSGVEVFGLPAPSIQWQRIVNGIWTAIPGATSKNLELKNIQSTDAGSYRIFASNASGTAVTSTTIQIEYPPLIVAQPTGSKLSLGQSYQLSVGYQATPSPTFQWKKDGIVLPGKTSVTLFISNAQPADSGKYTVDVSNKHGTVTSNSADVAVIAPPIITKQPTVPGIVVQNATVKINVQATSFTPLTYQWKKNNVNILGATEAEYVIPSVKRSDVGSYSVDISNVDGSVKSLATTIQKVEFPPIFVQQPTGGEYDLDQNVQIDTQVESDPESYFQWKKNGIDLVGQTLKTLSLNNIMAHDAGSYTLEVKNKHGSVTSNVVTIIVKTLPVFILQPTALAKLPVGGSLNLASDVSSYVAASFQWYKNDVVIVGATNKNFSISPLKITDSATYKVIATNPKGSVSSQSVSILVDFVPLVELNPTSKELEIGENFIWAAKVSSPTKATVQWYKENRDNTWQFMNCDSCQSENLTFSNIDQNQSGRWKIVVTNAVGSTEVTGILKVTGVRHRGKNGIILNKTGGFENAQ